MKLRRDAAGAHLFDRTSGLNVLLDEVEIPVELQHRAPRYVSVALTNACELKCPFCYAPKVPARLDRDRVLTWLMELDAEGCLGVGFGGGEPTAHPDFAWLVVEAASRTDLAMTVTTHGHRFDQGLADRLRGSIHFIRVSMDGVGATYESIRGRAFADFCARVDTIAETAPFGINTVVNAKTVAELDDVADFAVRAGAAELLLLVEQPVGSGRRMDSDTVRQLAGWLQGSRHPIRKAISRAEIPAGLSLADPFQVEPELVAHAHIDATGTLRSNAFSATGVRLEKSFFTGFEQLMKGAS